MDGTAYLIKETFSKDSIGQPIAAETSTEIYVHEGSVNRSEFYEAGQHGLSADLLLYTAAVNYSGEKLIRYNGEPYGIYRTYRDPDSDEIELYLERKAGYGTSESQS